MAGKLFFTLTYWLSNPPWDTGVTPPEVYDFLDQHPPGEALDLGCGTGTNVITLAQRGWKASGVDFVPRAIRKATRKARRAGVENLTKFLVGDVLQEGFIQGEFDLILDIGCFHSFSGEDIERYIKNITGLLVEGGRLLMYVHLNPDLVSGHGSTEGDLSKLSERLKLVWRQDGEESSRPSAWLEFRKDK
jgi:cyclopropane fatty-acyl-phospholipid synthase-like methyltransferase